MKPFALQNGRKIENARLVYGLIACIALVIAPHTTHLLPWVNLLCALLLAWRAYLAYSGSPLPPRWLLLVITLGGAGGILISFHTLFGREAGVTLVALLAVLTFVPTVPLVWSHARIVNAALLVPL